MHEASRDLVAQVPRHSGHPSGTFALRSPARPNPIASSVVHLVSVVGPVVTVRGRACVDGTRLIDLKPVWDAGAKGGAVTGAGLIYGGLGTYRDRRLPGGVGAAISPPCLRVRAWKGMPGRDCLPFSSTPDGQARTIRRPKCPN